MIFERCLHTIQAIIIKANVTIPITPEESSLDQAITIAQTGRLTPKPIEASAT